MSRRLGATGAINSDKTGDTLTMNQMMVSVVCTDGAWFTVDGDDYRKTGVIRSGYEVPMPDFRNLALSMVLDGGATVSDDGTVVSDPTEATRFVVLAAKVSVDAEEDLARRAPRLAEVPFDSAYKFMATFHRAQLGGRERVVALVKGGPDVVLARYTRSGGRSLSPTCASRTIASTSARRTSAWGRRASQVLAFAARLIDDGELDTMESDPMSAHPGPRLRGTPSA